MALTTEFREEVTASLNAAGMPAFTPAPSTVTIPAVIVIADDPYVIIDRLGPALAYTVAARIMVITPSRDNAAGLAANETLIDDVLAALPDGVMATRISAPLLDDMGAQGTAYVTEIQITAHVKEGN